MRKTWASLCAPSLGFASDTELSNIRILTDGDELECCYLYNPAPQPIPPTRRPLVGAVDPQNNHLPVLGGLGIQRGHDFRDLKSLGLRFISLVHSW